MSYSFRVFDGLFLDCFVAFYQGQAKGPVVKSLFQTVLKRGLKNSPSAIKDRHGYSVFAFNVT